MLDFKKLMYLLPILNYFYLIKSRCYEIDAAFYEI